MRAVLLGTIAAVATGCAQPGPIFPPADPALAWPPPPDEARITWIGQLATSADLGAPRSLGAVLFGDDEAATMQSPYGVCTDGGDRVFVSDSGAHVVHVFDLESRAYERWRPQAASGAETQTLGIAWDAPRGRLLVADGRAGCVWSVDGRGRTQGALGRGLLSRPSGVAVDAATGRVFVADAGAHEVVVLDADGVLSARLGGRGPGPGQFNFPTNVALDQAGRLYVSDSLNFRVQVFGRDLAPLRQFGQQGDLPGYFAQPKGVALDGDGHLYVVDAQFEAVQIFDDEGTLLLAFGHEGHGPGAFWLPAGIHVDSRDRIWIADSYNRRIQVFQYHRAGTEARLGTAMEEERTP